MKNTKDFYQANTGRAVGLRPGTTVQGMARGLQAWPLNVTRAKSKSYKCEKGWLRMKIIDNRNASAAIRDLSCLTGGTPFVFFSSRLCPHCNHYEGIFLSGIDKVSGTCVSCGAVHKWDQKAQVLPINAHIERNEELGDR